MKEDLVAQWPYDTRGSQRVLVQSPFWTGFRMALGALAAVMVASVVWGVALLVVVALAGSR